MRKLFAVLLSCVSSLASAGVLNVEFNFTAYVGNPAEADHVETVPGKAAVFVNNVPIADSEVGTMDVPVLFEEREISPSVWVPASSVGPTLRKGKNRIRIEFVPADAKAPYEAHLRWASVTDQEVRTENAGKTVATNQIGQGTETRKATGKVVFEREFDADFAADLPWHHYPPVTALTDADRRALATLVAQRAALFKPDFAAAYQFLKTARTPGMQLDLAGIRKSRILDKGYAAGLRIAAPAADTLELVVTGGQEVLIRSRAGHLFQPDLAALGRVKGAETQMALGMVLNVLFPPQLVAVRDPTGKWAVAY